MAKHQPTQRPRPWYCHDALTDDYRFIADQGGDLRMLKTLKIARSIIVNLGIISVSLFALIGTGADPTLVASLGLLTLGAYNGVEAAEIIAVGQAFAEARDAQQSDDDT